ncbi:restriction endonuclease subunit S [Sorangium sp. So ce131]|uniref:restriction endonuclease subunit S n=1 Tax=Sorangium sp. So ce131 TaxID=3133282 RepID=UPI003F6175EF
MSSEWAQMSVAELQRRGALLVEDGNHGEYRPRSNEFSTEGVAFIRAADMHHGRVLFNTAEKINDVAHRRIRKGIGARGDVLLSHKGTVGKVALVHDDAPPFVCSPQTTLWRCLDLGTLNPRFLFALLRSATFQSRLDALKGETDMADYVSLTTQRTLTIPVPPIREQRAIADVLGTLDDKIELNRRMNETLDAMARALFKNWFVDFDPVRVKMEGRAPVGMDAQTAALFPDSFEEHRDLTVPKRWRTRSLYNSATYINGAAYRDFHFTTEPGALPVIKIAELKSGLTQQTKFTRTIIAEKYQINNSDILFSWSGNPDTSIDTFVWHRGQGWLNQHIFKVVPHRDNQRLFVLYLLKWLRPRFAEIARNKQTTGLGHVTAEDMRRITVVEPPDPVLDAFNIVAGPLYQRWYANLHESESLAELRDLLLPRLLSGELRIKDAEKLAEAAP